ncbi:MAG: hypothetical protein WD360_04490 [Nitriliruptoraceae bacterium]
MILTLLRDHLACTQGIFAVNPVVGLNQACNSGGRHTVLAAPISRPSLGLEPRGIEISTLALKPVDATATRCSFACSTAHAYYCR